jgi:hypothetical protein
MNSIELNQLPSPQLSLSVAALVLVVLTILTVYSVIKRENAMIRQRRRNSGAPVVYMSVWRDQQSPPLVDGRRSQ